MAKVIRGLLYVTQDGGPSAANRHRPSFISGKLLTILIIKNKIIVKNLINKYKRDTNKRK